MADVERWLVVAPDLTRWFVSVSGPVKGWSVTQVAVSRLTLVVGLEVGAFNAPLPAAADLQRGQVIDGGVRDVTSYRYGYGYVRVSTLEQDPAGQLDAMAAGGVTRDRVFVEHASGALDSRPELAKVLAILRPGHGCGLSSKWKGSDTARTKPPRY